MRRRPSGPRSRAWGPVARHAVAPLLFVVVAVALVVGLVLLTWGSLASSGMDYRRTLAGAFVRIGIGTTALLVLASMRGEHGVLRPLLRRLPFDPAALIGVRLALVLPAVLMALFAGLAMESALRPAEVGPLAGVGFNVHEGSTLRRNGGVARVRLSHGEREVPALVGSAFLTMARLGGQGRPSYIRDPAEWWRRERQALDPDTFVGRFPMGATIDGPWSVFDLSRLGFEPDDEIDVRFLNYMPKEDYYRHISTEHLWAWLSGVVMFLGWSAVMVALAAFPRRSTSLTAVLLGAAWLAILLEPTWRAAILLALPFYVERHSALFELVPLVAPAVTIRGHLMLWALTGAVIMLAIGAGRWGIRRAYTGQSSPAWRHVAPRLRAWREDRRLMTAMVAISALVTLMVLGQVSIRGGYANEWLGVVGLFVGVFGLGIAALRMIVSWARRDQILSRLPVAPRRVATRRMAVLAFACVLFAGFVPTLVEHIPGLEAPSWAAGHGGARFSRDDAARLARHGTVPVLRAEGRAREMVARQAHHSPFPGLAVSDRDWSPPMGPFLARGHVLWSLLVHSPDKMDTLRVGDAIQTAAGAFTIVDLPRDRAAIARFLRTATPRQWGPVPGPQYGFRIAAVLVGGLLVFGVARLCRTVLTLHLVAITVLWLYVMGVGTGWRFGHQRGLPELPVSSWLSATLILALVGLGLWWHEQARVATGFRRRLPDS